MCSQISLIPEFYTISCNRITTGMYYIANMPTAPRKSKFVIPSPAKRLYIVFQEMIDKEKVNSRRDFAEKININYFRLSKVLTGLRPMSDEMANSVEKVFGISAKWILEGIDPKYI